MPEPKKWSLDTPIYDALKKIVPIMCPTIVSPTHITIFNAIVSAFILYSVYNKSNASWVIPLFILRVVLDMLDGTVARMCNKETEFGAWLDGTVDNLFYPIVFIALLFSKGQGDSLLTLAVLLVLVLHHTNDRVGEFLHDNTILLPFVFLLFVF